MPKTYVPNQQSQKYWVKPQTSTNVCRRLRRMIFVYFFIGLVLVGVDRLVGLVEVGLACGLLGSCLIGFGYFMFFCCFV